VRRTLSPLRSALAHDAASAGAYCVTGSTQASEFASPSGRVLETTFRLDGARDPTGISSCFVP